MTLKQLIEYLKSIEDNKVASFYVEGTHYYDDQFELILRMTIPKAKQSKY